MDVDVLLYSLSEIISQQQTETPADSTPNSEAPTINPKDSGLSDDVPLYPGATDLISMQNVLMVNSTDSIDGIVNFYLERMPALEWTLQSNVVSDGRTVLIWEKQERMVTITIQNANNISRLVMSEISGN